METEVKLTNCAGTLAKLPEGFKTHSDPRLIVGYITEKEDSYIILE